MLQAVLTGDVVNSRKNVQGTEFFRGMLLDTFAVLSKDISLELKYEIFRGDSFQIVIDQPQDALKVAMLIRARLIGAEYEKYDHQSMKWDARISIAIGSVDLIPENIASSSGEAFIRSGLELDKMKKAGPKITTYTPWKELKDDLEITTKALDFLIGSWDKKQARVVYYSFLKESTQKDLAKIIGITQPMVSKKIKQSGLKLAQMCVLHFRNLVTAKIDA